LKRRGRGERQGRRGQFFERLCGQALKKLQCLVSKLGAITASSVLLLQGIPWNIAGTIVASVNSMPNWGHVRRVLGETAREIGTLIFVFAPLESAFTERPLNQGSLIGIMLASILLIGSGILFEVRE
jgi:hypothetical protein